MAEAPISGPQQSSTFEAGILKSLVDFGFDSFATPKLIRILYILSFIGIALGAAFYFILGLASGEPFIVLVTLIVVPIVTLLMLIYVRVLVELLAILFRIGDNTTRMVAQLERLDPGGSSTS